MTDQSIPHTNHHAPSPERLGIAGAGTIACGLAVIAPTATLWARSDASAERARKTVAKLCDKIGADPESVTVATDLAALGEATYVVEAIAEDHGSKADLFGALAPELADDAILATTTSSLSVTELARASGRPERFAGLHVFNPVPKMELVELVFPEQAAEATRERSRALCEALGKTAVEVPDTPGFVVNRLLFPFLFEAVRLQERTGLESADVDSCVTLGAGHPLGPLALLDLVGLDVSAAIGETIEVEVPERVRELIAAEKLGRKSGAGFYEYG